MYVIVQKRNVHARRQNVNVRWYVRISKRFCVYACLPQIWQSHVIRRMIGLYQSKETFCIFRNGN